MGESYNTFAVESAVDELAVSLSQDPIDYRKRMLGSEPRAQAVLQKLQTSSNYTGVV